jgi:mannose-1-phosphate guanylyltransferase
VSTTGAGPGGTTGEAVLLVGGLGTRLRPLTLRTPKPMLPVAGVPFVLHQLSRLRDAGFGHVVLATSYRPEVFQGVLGDGSTFGVELEYATEDSPLGTGGGIRNALDRLRSGPDEPVVVLNGDILSGHDLPGQVRRHCDASAAVTLHLTVVEDPRAFGSVPTDPTGRVTAFLEKMPDPVTNQVNAGCYVFRRSVLDGIPAGRPVSVERETFPELVAAGEIVLGVVDQAYWLDVGTPQAYVAASRDLILGRIASAAVPGPTGEALLLPGAVVEPGASVGGGTVVGSGARVLDGATVEGSVLLGGAVVRAGAQVRSCALGADTVVGERSVLAGVVVGDGARVGADCELPDGMRVWTDVVLPDRGVRMSSDTT